MAWANQVAVITGASSGIGWSLAKALAGKGCKVGLIARRQELLKQLGQEIQQAGGQCATAAADVADRQATLSAFAQLREQLGPVDLLVANAGVGCPTTLEPINIDDIEKMYRINVFGVIYSIEAVLPEMLSRGRGHLAAVSSLGGYKGLPGESAYCSTKAALSCYMEGLRIQLRTRGVHVTTICPGFVKTPMTEVIQAKMPFMMSADEAARRIVPALERKKKVFDFPWQTSWLVKLSRWLPDWIVALTLAEHNENSPIPKGPL